MRHLIQNAGAVVRSIWRWGDVSIKVLFSGRCDEETADADSGRESAGVGSVSVMVDPTSWSLGGGGVDSWWGQSLDVAAGLIMFCVLKHIRLGTISGCDITSGIDMSAMLVATPPPTQQPDVGSAL